MRTRRNASIAVSKYLVYDDVSERGEVPVVL